MRRPHFRTTPLVLTGSCGAAFVAAIGADSAANDALHGASLLGIAAGQAVGVVLVLEGLTRLSNNLRTYRSCAAAGALVLLASLFAVLLPSAKGHVSRRSRSPLRVTVQDDPIEPNDGFSTAFASVPTDDTALLRARSCGSLFRASKRLGGTDVAREVANVQLEGANPGTIAIVGMYARILQDKPALTGALALCESGGAEAATGIEFALNSRNAIARTADSDSPGHGRPFFANGSIIPVSRGHFQPLQVTAVLPRGDIKWEIVAQVIINGAKRNVVINDNGHPFHVTSESGRPSPSRGPFQPAYRRYYEWNVFGVPPKLVAGPSLPQ